MGFGQPTGPSASARQVKDLLALVLEAGHRDFRDAARPTVEIAQEITNVAHSSQSLGAAR